MLLLDTNVISEYRKVSKGKAHQSFTLWQQGIPLQHLYLSSITIMELNIGILRLARKDDIQANHLRYWLENKIIPNFTNRIIAFDMTAALACSSLHIPDPRPERDAMIAATAMVNDLTLVTRNIKDFKNMEVPLINPFV